MVLRLVPFVVLPPCGVLLADFGASRQGTGSGIGIYIGIIRAFDDSRRAVFFADGFNGLLVSMPVVGENRPKDGPPACKV